MPILAKPAIIWTALIYLSLVVVIGIWAARRTRSAKDFFIAGQGIGLLVTALATMSAAFSGFVFIGGPGLTYRMGLASLFICIPVSFTAGLLCWVVAKRLRLLAGVREIYTVPDVIYCRYRSRLASGLAAVAVIVGTVGYLGAQLKALGILIEAIFGTRELLGEWSLAVAMLIGLVVVVFYATAGGMVAGRLHRSLPGRAHGRRRHRGLLLRPASRRRTREPWRGPSSSPTPSVPATSIRWAPSRSSPPWASFSSLPWATSASRTCCTSSSCSTTRASSSGCR